LYGAAECLTKWIDDGILELSTSDQTQPGDGTLSAGIIPSTKEQ